MNTLIMSIFICKSIFSAIQTKKSLPSVKTEDLGKIFEMAICLTYDIPFDGNYKYSLEEANKLKDRIQKVVEVFPYSLKHIAKNGSPHDFVSLCDSTYLSAKTTKKNAKVCPQVIGQPSKKKFCEFVGVQLNDLEAVSYTHLTLPTNREV